MQKIKIYMTVTMLVLLIGTITLIRIISHEINTEIDSAKAEVGQRVIFDGDTLMIVDYSVINRNYTLSNGGKISFDLADQIKCGGKTNTKH